MEATSAFDREYSLGDRTSGWYQSKARYFNDIVVALVESETGATIATRGKRKSVLFSDIDIDMCFPMTGDPIVAAEVKALGTPPHPRNEMKGRGARSDLHKRVREVAFTSMDLKAAYSRRAPIDSFQAWVDATSPTYLSFWSLRVDGRSDHEQVREIVHSLRSYCNGVGAIIYEARSGNFDYVAHRHPSSSMHRAIGEFSQRVVSAKLEGGGS